MAIIIRGARNLGQASLAVESRTLPSGLGITLLPGTRLVALFDRSRVMGVPIADTKQIRLTITMVAKLRQASKVALGETAGYVATRDDTTSIQLEQAIVGTEVDTGKEIIIPADAQRWVWLPIGTNIVVPSLGARRGGRDGAAAGDVLDETGLPVERKVPSWVWWLAGAVVVLGGGGLATWLLLRRRGGRSRGMGQFGPDHEAPTETELWVDNNEPLYRMKLAIWKNLMGKCRRGIFNADLARQAFTHLTRQANKSYSKEIGEHAVDCLRRQARGWRDG